MNLLKLKPKGRFVFVGDTHGDLDASKNVIKKYLDGNTIICPLGDYPDRGYDSKGNVDYIISLKEKYPKNFFPLQGNHENYRTFPFDSADFWEGLSEEEMNHYSNIFEKFPLVLSVGNIIALHGALPDVKKIEDINKIRNFRDINLKAILWGDFEERINYDGDWSYSGSRPTFGKKYFERIMQRLGKNVLIRSHQPWANERMFDNKCLTIFTSNAYGGEKTVAIADFDKKKKIESIDDLIIERI